MDAEAVRKLWMGLEWVFLARVDTGSYRIIDWIVSYFRLDHIVSAGLDRVVSAGSGNTGFLWAGWLLAGWDRWTGWGVGGAGVGRTDVSTHRNKSATMGAGTGALPLALEGRRAIGSGGWHQLRRCCKGAEYLCRRSKIIQIECTWIGTNS